MEFETVNKVEDLPTADDFIKLEQEHITREQIVPEKPENKEKTPEKNIDAPKQKDDTEPPKQAKKDEVKGIDMTFTKELRKATREVHKISDVVVNAKFAFALSDDAVWADGLLSFFEIYKYLENNLPEDLLPNELRRTAAFEKDLKYFLGDDWKETYEPRDSVKKYLAHLEEVNNKSKILLFAYALQMYMAMMSGGQLLQKKRMIARKLWIGKKEEEPKAKEEPVDIADEDISELEKRPMPLQINICPEGCAVTYFPETIQVLKDKLRTILNKHYEKFDEKMKADFIEETRNVFIYNTDVIRSIKGVNRANLRKLAMVLVFVVGVYLALKLARR